MIPKHTYVRSKQFLRMVAELECQSCGAYPSQAAHSNWHGKGMGLKASDVYVAALCLKCHWEIDQGNKLSKQDRKDKWMAAWRSTVKTMQNRGKWPQDIEVPDVESDL